MFRIRKSKTFFKDRMNKLMRKKRNEKLKSIIEMEENYPTLSDSTGTTLLHIAARYNNTEMIRYSISLGCDVDAKDSLGTTPLMVATKLNHCSAMRLLLNANADVFATNSAAEYPLQLMFDRNKTVFYSNIINIYYDKVKSRCSSDDEVAEKLLKAGCSLDQAVIMHDPQVTRSFLENVEIFDEIISCRSVLISMFRIDSENLEVLLRHGSQVNQRIEDFLWYLHDICNTGIVQKKQTIFFGQSKALETLLAFTRKIIDWDLLDQENLKFLKYIFEDADKEILKIFLEADIHTYVQSRFSYNLLAHVYGNRCPGTIPLLRNMNCDTNAYSNTGREGITALHLAVFRCIPDNVKLLLDMGADPNVADEHGETPMFCALNSKEPLKLKIECLDLLLKSNADVEVHDNAGISFIEYVDLERDDHLTLVEPVLAHLALLGAIGLPVKQSTVEYIVKHDELRIRYETCQRQLDEMKTRKVARAFSLISVLTSNPEDIARFVGAQIGLIIATLMRGDYLRELNVYYAKRFKERLNRALKVHELRSKAARIIVQSIPTFSCYYPVVDKIISYLDYQELLMFT